MSRRDDPVTGDLSRLGGTASDETYLEERWDGPPPTFYVLVAIILATLGPLVTALLLAL